MKKTAVEFAVEKLEKFIPSGNQLAVELILEQAKEMEEEQIMKVVMDFGWSKEKAEQYYNTTFKQAQ
jgi:hypothetical protein